MIRTLTAATLVLTVTACTRTHTLPEPDGSVTRLDGGPAGLDTGPPARTCAERGGPVDVLFVIDNSNDMAEQHVELGRQLPAFIEALLAPPDRDGDGAGDWQPADSVQLGVVTTDMGTGGFTVPTCTEPNFGDDGILRTVGNTGISDCAASYPPFLSARPGDDVAAVSTALRCVAVMGTGGCGFEQQLEATLKAVTPATSPTEFVMGTRGQADRANAGFVRPDSLLAVVLLTTEVDCSAADPELFNPSSEVYGGNLGLRCVLHPGAMHPVSRYADGLLALRADRRDQLVYALIAGVPTDLIGAPMRTDWDAMLADPRMQVMPDPEEPRRIAPSCNVPGRGLTHPPRRMVEVARSLEAQGAIAVVQSICQLDYTEPMRVIAEAIGRNACSRFLD